MSSQKKKVTLYFNAGMLAETQKEALRQDRSVSWIIQAAWKIARDEVRQTPGVLPAGKSQADALDAKMDETIDETMDETMPDAMEDALESGMESGMEEPTPPPAPALRPVSRV